MLTRPVPNDSAPRRSRRRERKLWHDGAHHTPSLGCVSCRDREICGGLQIAASLFDCLNFCCGEPDSCDRVCRNHPDFPDRVREVGGFALDAVPRAPLLSTPVLPRVIPVLFHGNSRKETITPAAVALSLYKMFDRADGSPRFVSRQALCAAYGIAPTTPIVLTGTDRDPPLERWWGLGEVRRRATIRALHAVGVVLVTTPNYSLFLDRPRWDDLHAMKRIAIVHQEFLDEGLPAALHVNSRTETDFRRWAAYINGRPEVTHIAYEFTTGTGWAGRREQHAAWLAELAATVGRPLHLVVRGGVQVLPALIKAFTDLTILETSVFMKTMMRQRAVPAGNSRIAWRPSPTAIGAPLDALFAENRAMVESWLGDLTAPAQTAMTGNAAQA